MYRIVKKPLRGFVNFLRLILISCISVTASSNIRARGIFCFTHASLERLRDCAWNITTLLPVEVQQPCSVLSCIAWNSSNLQRCHGFSSAYYFPVFKQLYMEPTQGSLSALRARARSRSEANTFSNSSGVMNSQCCFQLQEKQQIVNVWPEPWGKTSAWWLRPPLSDNSLTSLLDVQ